LAEINLFLIFLGSIGFDLLTGDPRFLIHPVQVIGFYIKKISDYLINNFGEPKFIFIIKRKIKKGKTIKIPPIVGVLLFLK